MMIVADSIITGMRDYIAACPLMAEFDTKHRHIDWTDADNDNYGIFPDNDRLIEKYIDGTQMRQYVCQITIRKFSKADADRLKNSEFIERLQSWFDEQCELDNLPQLPEDCTADEIHAENAMLSELSVTGKTGTYTVQIIMQYVKE